MFKSPISQGIISAARRCVKHSLALIAPLATVLASAAGADVSTPCPRPEVRSECVGGQGFVTLSMPGGGAAGLRFLISDQGADLLGESRAPVEIAPGESRRLVLAPGATENGSNRAVLAILGREPGTDGTLGDCCFTNLSLALPTCPTTPGSDTNSANTETVLNEPPPPPPADRGIALTLATECTRSAAGLRCAGAIRLGGDAAPGPVTVSLRTHPPLAATLATAPPSDCVTSRRGAMLCDLPGAPDTVATLTLPGTAGPGPLRVCAELGAGDDPVAQTLALQRALAATGHEPGAIDGVEGPATRNALQRAKAARGMTDDPAPLPAALATALGLAPYADRDPTNDLSCATVQLPSPPLVCDRASTRATDGACACRHKGMQRQSATACACPRGQRLTDKGCVARTSGGGGGGGGGVIDTPPPPPSCEPLTTVLRNGTCACRYAGMMRLNARTCLCENGLPPLPGVGCVRLKRDGVAGAGP